MIISPKSWLEPFRWHSRRLAVCQLSPPPRSCFSSAPKKPSRCTERFLGAGALGVKAGKIDRFLSCSFAWGVLSCHVFPTALGASLLHLPPCISCSISPPRICCSIFPMRLPSMQQEDGLSVVAVKGWDVLQPGKRDGAGDEPGVGWFIPVRRSFGC